MSGELQNEIENIKEFCLEEIGQVQSQEDLQNVWDKYTRKKIFGRLRFNGAPAMRRSDGDR